MDRRIFIKALGLSSLGVVVKSPAPVLKSFLSGGKNDKYKYWIWVGTDTHASIDDWKNRFAVMKQNGIDAILPEIYNSRKAFYQSSHLPVAEPWLEKILPLAKAEGLEVHAWMWSMPCNVEDIVKNHPDWFVVNRNGESAAVKPAYVNYYKFLCASHPEAREFVKTTVTELSNISDLDGVHLDYIRFPDVKLPPTLQPHYNIVQDKEYPQYDYCYCDLCRHDFEEQTGIDPLKLDDPAHNEKWNEFRYNRISYLVNEMLIPTAHKNGKVISAAVFPNWKDVRQQWSVWKLDSVLPMLYNGFYNEGIDWIKEKTAVEVKSSIYHVPLYSGLMVSQLKDELLGEAIAAAYGGGASGVSLFSAGSMNNENWKEFKESIKK
jgi:uncharacterized lipoprotein YddW (UPF0748 family)